MPLSTSFLSSYRYGNQGYAFSYRFSELDEEDEPVSFIRTEVHYILLEDLEGDLESIFSSLDITGQSIIRNLRTNLPCETIMSKNSYTKQLSPGTLLLSLSCLFMSHYFRRLGVPDDVTSKLIPDLFDFTRSKEGNNRPTHILVSIDVRTMQYKGETKEDVYARMIKNDTFYYNFGVEKELFAISANILTKTCNWLLHDTMDVEHCSICLERNLPGKKCTGTRLPCSHLYHAPCILGWMMKNQTCPLCRSRMFPWWFPKALSSFMSPRNYLMQQTDNFNEYWDTIAVEAAKRDMGWNLHNFSATSPYSFAMDSMC